MTSVPLASLPSAAAQQSSGSSIAPLVLLLLIGGVTYLMLIRPQRRRAKQLRETQAELSLGAEVMTTAGLYATVVAYNDETITLETSPGVHSRYARAAVARILTPAPVGDDSAGGAVPPAV